MNILNFVNNCPSENSVKVDIKNEAFSIKLQV